VRGDLQVIYNRQVAKQQMANATLKNSNERRYFQGVMGPNGKWVEDGELGGISNLFSVGACAIAITPPDALCSDGCVKSIWLLLPWSAVNEG
jgi:hypothetical protein